MTSKTALRAAIAGGSIGGLFAAHALRQIGWAVDVFEKSSEALSSRGAGIVSHAELETAFQTVGLSTDNFGVQVRTRIVVDQSGAVIRKIPLPQTVTSWNTIYRILHSALPKECYHLGISVHSYKNLKDGVEVIFQGEPPQKYDLLIGADGIRSNIRAQLCPKTKPLYSGYIVWRAVADERDLNMSLEPEFIDSFGFYLPEGLQVLGYPIAGEENSLIQGERRYNMVWYRPTSPTQLQEILRDSNGKTHALSTPPRLIKPHVIDEMRRFAKLYLPHQFNAVLDNTEVPFASPIYDYLVENYVDGHVALIGDAACLARPHIGMGVTKAAQDALCLASELKKHRKINEALASFELKRHAKAALATRQARLMGQYVTSTGTHPNKDGRHHPFMEKIIQETAVSKYAL